MTDWMLYVFTAEWCQPCKTLKPRLHKVAKNFSNIKIHEIDAEERMDLAAKHNVRSVPTVVLLKDHSEFDGFTGNISEDEIRIFLQQTKNE